MEESDLDFRLMIENEPMENNKSKKYVIFFFWRSTRDEGGMEAYCLFLRAEFPYSYCPLSSKWELISHSLCKRMVNPRTPSNAYLSLG